MLRRLERLSIQKPSNVTYRYSLKQSDFIVLLKSTVYNPEPEPTRKRLGQAYERFLARMNKLVRSRKSPVDKLRALTLAYETINLIRIGIHDMGCIRKTAFI